MQNNQVQKNHIKLIAIQWIFKILCKNLKSLILINNRNKFKPSKINYFLTIHLKNIKKLLIKIILNFELLKIVILSKIKTVYRERMLLNLINNQIKNRSKISIKIHIKMKLNNLANSNQIINMKYL